MLIWQGRIKLGSGILQKQYVIGCLIKNIGEAGTYSIEEITAEAETNNGPCGAGQTDNSV